MENRHRISSLWFIRLSRKACALTVLICALSLSASAQSAAWLDSSWTYRAPVAVSNTSGGNLSQFQVQIVLGASFDFARANQNGSDVRVTDSDGSTVLPIWIQSWNPQQSSATIWVKVPNIPGTGTTLYLYYGNPTANGVSSGDATFEFFDDFSYASSSISVSSAVGKAVSWITRAQDAFSPGGVSHWYDVGSQSWFPGGYAEVTGYIIPTIYDIAAGTTDPILAADLRNRAKRMADWEVSIQGSDGSWTVVFDTGQIIEGLGRAYRETGNSAYLNSASRAGDWLISVQGSNGSWPTDFGGFAKAYDARVSRALLQLWQATGTSRYRDAAVNNLNWDVSQQRANGWFDTLGINSPSENSSPLTHTIAYTMEGLLDSGIILNNSTYINAARKTADALLSQQQLDGSLTGGNYASDWTPTVADQCLTGSAQTALVWLKLYQYTVNLGVPDSRYLNAAVRLNQYLARVQGNSSNPGIDGGLAGSDPINGNYMGNRILSWATKFLVDDLNLELKFVPNATVPVYALDPSKWSFPAGQAGFTNVNGLLKYNGPSRTAANARAVAIKGGNNIVFSDGIVEYNVQGNGGYDEMGLMYRGQNPETANSYVFYPSIWNSQNTWLLYGLESSVETPIASGGSFTPGVWYAVKAAVSGASHSFWINGTQVFATADGTFSTGTLGVLPWGNAIAWISTFRARKYAATEPTTTVGAEQTGTPAIVSLVMNPTSVAGGNSSTGTVTLNVTTGGVVALFSSNTSVATVQANVTVPSGSTTASFPVNTVAVTTAASVTISGTYSSTTKTANLLVTPAINSLTLNPNSVVGGNASTGTVTVTGAAPAGGMVIALSSSNTSAATVPASVTIPQGTNSVTFTVTTLGVTTSSSVTTTASYGGSSKTAILTVGPADVSSVSLNPSAVVGGSASTGTVTLNGAAPPGGAVVGLSSSNTAAATVPATVTVSANNPQASFNVTTYGVSASTTSTISAMYRALTRTAILTVTPFNVAWAYRRPVSVSNSSGSTLTNFQVRILLDSSFSFSKAQSNGADVRFTTSDGVTLIPFWIESWNPANSSAVIWVQVPSIPTSGVTIYLYYGNPGATTASNGNAAFTFFDDFSYTNGGTPAIDPSKWSFPAGQAGFSNLGGMLQYNGPFSGFGPRALAMQGGATIAFSNGVVEYNLNSNGGYDEMGLVYRGQNPETANSYVFYPSIWNSQNTWLLYSRISNGEVRLGSGGSFTPNVWYAVKAAIGGSSHSFSINGSQIFTVSDSAFASGTVGLLAWGNTVSWVTNYRIRKYAASEPATVVGAEQPGH